MMSKPGMVKRGIIKAYLGVALVFAGALLLLVSYLTGLTRYNLVLLTGLIFIVLGAVLHVRQQKRGEKY
jgi:membrane-bound ClpP family serine protease